MKPITINRAEYGVWGRSGNELKKLKVETFLKGGYEYEKHFYINTPSGQFEMIPPNRSGFYQGHVITFVDVSQAGNHKGEVFGVEIDTDANGTHQPWSFIIRKEIDTEMYTYDIKGLGLLLKELTSYVHNVIYISERMLEFPVRQFATPSKNYVSYLGDYKPVTKKPKKTITQTMGIRLFMNGQIGEIGGYEYSDMSHRADKWESEPTTKNNYGYADDLGGRTKLEYYSGHEGGDYLGIRYHSNSKADFKFIDPKLMAEKPKPKPNLGGGAPSDTFGY